jgi:hypothetical protein
MTGLTRTVLKHRLRTRTKHSDSGGRWLPTARRRTMDSRPTGKVALDAAAGS